MKKKSNLALLLPVLVCMLSTGCTTRFKLHGPVPSSCTRLVILVDDRCSENLLKYHFRTVLYNKVKQGGTPVQLSAPGHGTYNRKDVRKHFARFFNADGILQILITEANPAHPYRPGVNKVRMEGRFFNFPHMHLLWEFTMTLRPKHWATTETVDALAEKLLGKMKKAGLL